MAEDTDVDPFTPSKLPTTQGGQSFEALSQQWDSFLTNPKNLSAVMSAGIALTQPLRWGDSGLSHASRALGAAGESVRLSEEQERKERELSSKEQLRESQAIAAEARAGAAASRAGAAGDRSALQAERLQAMKERHDLQMRVKLSGDYQRYSKSVDEQNAKNTLLGQPPIPKLGIQEWIEKNTLAGNIAPTSSGRPVTAPQVENPDIDTDAPPSAPSDPSQRVRNQTYSTPRGVLKWTGTGWVSP